MKNLTELQKLLVTIKWNVAETEISELETKNLEKMEKANEVYHTTNTNYGSELIPTNIVQDPLVDMVYKTNDLLAKLPWNHWTNLPVSAKVPVIGEATLMRLNTEYTTGSFSSTATKDGFLTDDVTITQVPFIAEYFVSDRELTYSVTNLEALARQKLAQSANRTINALLLNADTATTGNVNTSGTPSSTVYYMGADNGIRKVGISNTALDLSTLTDGDFLTMINALGNYASQIEDLLFLSPANVSTKALGLDSVKTMEKFGNEATIKTGVFSKVFGIENMILRDFPALTLATGKVHASTGNDYGSIALIYKPAVQYWFGKTPEYGSERIIGKWVRVVAAMEFGFTIVNQKAGLDKTVALWVNISMA